MIRGSVVVLAAVALGLLGGCGARDGDEFVGKWQSAKTRQSVEISRNDDGFIIANTTGGGTKGVAIAAAYRNGSLEVNTGGGTESIAYNKEHDLIVLPTMAGATPFTRVK
ncbi:type IV pilus biogenesis protein CpaD/CtpE [Paraburkholderia sp. GAS41]|jgi:type IV pilus biogenesis protein CpaD/CtpE|uniref:DUF3876 domain-containing protein n=1 Tax=Paraburkholderia sp. GAS41 TaxID=3035134 RepID=UPI003D1DF330